MRRQFLRRLLGTALLPLLLTPAATAATQDVFALFDEFLAMPQASISFIQTTYSKKGVILEQTKGDLIYQRGGKFRLQYFSGTNPLVVSDGKTVWVYEESLNQVIVQPFSSARKSGLVELIASGDADSLKKNYVLSASISGVLQWLNADALDTDTSVRRMSLGFKDNTLQEVSIEDHFDSRLKMQITNISDTINSDTQFTFTPPPGSELINTE